MRYGIQNCMTEWSFSSGKRYQDPFNEVEMSVVFTGPDGEKKEIPAFWAGDYVWRVRFATPVVGRHHYETVCADTKNPDLHGQKGEIEITPYDGNNSLFQHGPLRVEKNGHYLEHIDGTPFFWLGDTWWYGLVREFRWPGEFQELVADRVSKGFNLIQLVVGYLPAMPKGDLRCGNEAGLPWTTDYQRINPRFFDMADLRIDYLVRNGLVPCIFGSWGYWLLRLGVKKAKQHWRYLVARYGAYPLVWCLCGEVQMLYPDVLPKSEAEHRRNMEFLRKGWSEVGRYLGEIDPYKHPLTAHTNAGHDSREELENGVPITMSLTQTGHKFATLPTMIESVRRIRMKTPRIPVIIGECVYEGIFGSNWQDVQRFAIWTCILNGAAGHTYGAEGGGWQIHHHENEPFHYTSGAWAQFNDWRDIAALPGSSQLVFCKELLERYPWWRFEPHPEWLQIEGENDKCFVPHVAGIAKKVRVIYIPSRNHRVGKLSAVVKLEKEVEYRAYFYDPRCGDEHPLGIVHSEDGRWQPPPNPSMLDWVIVLETSDAQEKQ